MEECAAGHGVVGENDSVGGQRRDLFGGQRPDPAPLGWGDGGQTEEVGVAVVGVGVEEVGVGQRRGGGFERGLGGGVDAGKQQLGRVGVAGQR